MDNALTNNTILYFSKNRSKLALLTSLTFHHASLTIAAELDNKTIPPILYYRILKVHFTTRDGLGKLFSHPCKSTRLWKSPLFSIVGSGNGPERNTYQMAPLIIARKDAILGV